MEADERARVDHLRDRKPLLGAVSPGRGRQRVLTYFGMTYFGTLHFNGRLAL